MFLSQTAYNVYPKERQTSIAVFISCCFLQGGQIISLSFWQEVTAKEVSSFGKIVRFVEGNQGFDKGNLSFYFSLII